MKRSIILSAAVCLLCLCIYSPVNAASKRGTGGSGTGSKQSSSSVKGHTTKKGAYVAPHHRTTPDKSKSNNYSAKGNVNPHNGKVGTRSVK